MGTQTKRRPGPALWLALAGLILGCSRNPAPPPETQPPTVTVSQPIEREIRDYEEYPGRTEAVDSVQLRSRISGYLEKIAFREGAEVNKGDLLYEIDPRPYQAALNQAEAQVRLQQAQLKYNEALYARDLKLVGSGGVSQEEVQKDLAARDTAAAALNAARASADQARVNLGYTKIVAPISGRVGRTQVTRGNLVVADQTLLTTLVSLDPIWAYFDVDEPTVLRIQQLIREGKFKSAREQGVRVPLWLRLISEKDFAHEGFVDFINNQVDPTTGTLQVRGTFANPKPPVGDRVLSPGLFVRVRVAIGPPYRALLIDERALGTDQNLKFVYIVNDKGEVERRDVQLGTKQGSLQAIAQGLKPTDWVIVNGLQRVRPRMKVTAHEVKMPEAKSLDR